MCCSFLRLTLDLYGAVDLKMKLANLHVTLPVHELNIGVKQPSCVYFTILLMHRSQDFM